MTPSSLCHLRHSISHHFLLEDVATNLASKVGNYAQQVLPNTLNPSCEARNVISFAASWHCFRKHAFPLDLKNVVMACRDHNFVLVHPPKLRPARNGFCVAMSLQFLQDSFQTREDDYATVSERFKNGADHKAVALQSIHDQLHAVGTSISPCILELQDRLNKGKEIVNLGEEKWQQTLFSTFLEYLNCENPNKGSLRSWLWMAGGKNLNEKYYRAAIDLEALFHSYRLGAPPYTQLSIDSKKVLAQLLNLVLCQEFCGMLNYQDAASRLSQMPGGHYLISLPGHCIALIHKQGAWHLFDPSYGYTVYNNLETAQNLLQKGLRKRCGTASQRIIILSCNPK